MHQCSEELAIATIAGAVVSGGDHVGTDRSEDADASAHRGIPIAAITANSRDLARGLIKIPDVGLMGEGCRKGARPRHVERLECSVAAVAPAPRKKTVPRLP